MAVPSWLAVGARALDMAKDRIGVVQLFRARRGSVQSHEPLAHLTQVLLRPVGDGAPWWAHSGHVAQPPERELGLAHRSHPLLGCPVIDTATGRTGILRAICPEPTDDAAYARQVLRPGNGPLMAWLAPIAGGCEWTTPPDAIRAAGG